MGRLIERLEFVVLIFFTFKVHVALGSIRLSQLFPLVILACFEHACGFRADRLQSAVACHDVFVVHRGRTTKTVVFVFLASLACSVHAHFVSFLFVQFDFHGVMQFSGKVLQVQMTYFVEYVMSSCTNEIRRMI